MSHPNAMPMSHARRMRAVVLCALVALVAGAATAARAEAQAAIPAKTDWTSVTATTATGTLLGSAVTLRSPAFDLRTASHVGDGSTLFSSPVFTPALAKSDVIYVSGPPAGGASTYTVEISAPIKDPVFHFASLGSEVTFPGRAVTKISGEPDLFDGATVKGTPSNDRVPSGIEDANGTIKVLGTFDRTTPITFTIRQRPGFAVSGTDGIYVQLLAAAECTNWTSVTGTTAAGTLLGGAPSVSSPSYDLRIGTKLDASSTIFSRPPFSPLLPTSDLLYVSGPPAGGTYSYTIALTKKLEFPIIQLASLGSQVTFPGATAVTRVGDADPGFAPGLVRGVLAVTGIPTNTRGPSGIEDANGTVRLTGPFGAGQPIRLDAVQTPEHPLASQDGIYVQLCSTG